MTQTTFFWWWILHQVVTQTRPELSVRDFLDFGSVYPLSGQFYRTEWVAHSGSFDLWLLEAQFKFVWKPNKYWSPWLKSPFPLTAQVRVTRSKHLYVAMQQIDDNDWWSPFLLASSFSIECCTIISSPFFCASSWSSGLQSTPLQQWLFNWVALYPVFLCSFALTLCSL